MAIILVAYDLKEPADYQPVYDYLESFIYYKGLESVYLIDTDKTTKDIRDHLKTLVKKDDVVFATKIQKNWAAGRFQCSDWLKSTDRNW